MQKLESINISLVQCKARPDPRNKMSWFRHNGWGYKDTQFVLRPDGAVMLTGNRYQFAGQRLPKFRQWAQTQIGIQIAKPMADPQASVMVQPSKLDQSICSGLKKIVDQVTQQAAARVMHSHGHTLQQVYALRHGRLSRNADAVVYVTSHQQVQKLAQFAKQNALKLIPYGGGTNVTQALGLNKEQEKPVLSVDLSRMNRVKWVDKKNMCASIQCGIMGRDMQKQLSKHGVMCGHQPDSVQFSTLGGWISTRASGMKKNRYGNIDDILINFKIVTGCGTLSRNQNIPRLSSGPDLLELILGHQGNFGIITEAVVKVRYIPQIQIYDSVIFHDFQIGQNFMYDVAQSKAWPASIRTVDNNQFRFGMALKTQSKDKLSQIKDKAKKYFVTQFMKFDPNKMCLTTLVYEGSKQQVAMQQKVIKGLTKKYKGFSAGPQNGERGYFLTFVIAYLRDFALRYGFIAQSFQTSVQWSNVKKLCSQVKIRVENQCKKHKIIRQPFISFRVTQVYDTGAAVYIYFGFLYRGIQDPVDVYTQIQDAARDQIMKNGGSISHHHGVGKIRKRFLPQSIGSIGISAISALKKSFDPNDIFGCGNLI